MKREIFLLVVLSMMIGFMSCQKTDDYREPASSDLSQPAPPTNIRVENYNGGANIIYDLPPNSNALYVMADYVINDSTGAARQTKTSYYTDTTKVEGFAKSQPYTVTLKTVSRANVESDPVSVTVHPDTPPYLQVAENIQMQATFGGVNATTTNPAGEGVTLVYLYDNPDFGQYVIHEQQYFDALEISYPIRGFEAEPTNFGMYVTDRFGNKSETTYATVTPIYEVLLDKSKFYRYELQSDGGQLGNWHTEYMWDNVTVGNNFWHSAEIYTGYPYVVTFGLGQEVRLSRFILHQRNTWAWSYWDSGCIEKFSLWGSAADNPDDVELPVFAPEGTVLGDWVNLANYDFPLPPSGNPASSPSEADREWWNSGADFTLPENSPTVKFLRVCVSDTWGNHVATYICELTLYGGL